MESTELFYPELDAEIGGYNFQDGISIEVYSNKKSYFDWARVRFTGEFQDKIEIGKREKAILMLGYDGNLFRVFEGYVAKPYHSTGENEILLKDEMILLEETFVANTFLNGTPQEILEWCLKKAGVNRFKISSKSYPVKKSVSLSKRSVLAVINSIHALWKIEEDFFFSDGIFYWGEKPEQDRIYKFEYGSNIISLTRVSGCWELETVSAPFIKHSHTIEVEHPKVSGEFEVEKVTFTTTASGFIRTVITFK